MAGIAERRRVLGERQAEVERRLQGHAEERATAATRRQRLEAEGAALARLEVLVEQEHARLDGIFESLRHDYQDQVDAVRAGGEKLEQLRQDRHTTEQRLDAVRTRTRTLDLEANEVDLRTEALHEHVLRDLGATPEDLVGLPEPEAPEGTTLTQHAEELERKLVALGPVNPLALEELSTLEERHKELEAQVDDVRGARRELHEVVRTLDHEIMTSFAAAAADVNEHFSALVAMLFPGGTGRLVLLEPDDLLNTGVEIEVRPAGRNVRRVSLLSGGERSMAALAFLFAVFRSRPSPFYMMDEVEAALDDVNLSRFLALVHEFRDEAQLLIVSHQKRTMETGDALYGVTMAPGGSSQVVSQKVEKEPSTHDRSHGRLLHHPRRRGRRPGAGPRGDRRHPLPATGWRGDGGAAGGAPGAAPDSTAPGRRRLRRPTGRRRAATVEAPPAPGVEAPPSYRSRLGGVRGLFSGAVSALRSGRIDAATWDSLEEALIRADVGVATTTALLEELRAKVDAKEIKGGDDLLEALGASIRQLLETGGSRALHFDGRQGSPDVWLFVGVNGVGKTTTIGKLARRQSAAGHSVLLAAGDTFRAAAADQLGLWAERTGTEIVRGAEGADPSAIVFDAVQRAAARGNDLVLADTAGRLHTKVNLVEELKKIRRVADRDPGNVTEVLLVLDATTGQNGLAQARQFADAVDVTGIVLTKLDGTAKGGIVIAVQRELFVPVKLVGLGEGPDDLVDFDPDEFVDALLAGD